MRIPIVLIAIAWSFSVLGQGSGHTLDFDGSNDHVVIPNDSTLNPSSQLTLEAWINADAYANNIWENSIISKDTWSSISEGYVLRCGQGGRLSFNLALNNNSQWYEVQSSAVMSTGKWYHVAGVYDGSTMKIYLNGEMIQSTSQTGSITSTTVPVKIGEIARSSGGRNFNGKIDEARIWRTALSDTLIRRYMCRKVDNTHPKFNDLVGYWNLDEGTGSTVTDLSGKGNNGTVTNGPVWEYSGAHIGYNSAYLYTSSWTGKSVEMGHNQGDSMTISSITGSPDAVHVYLVDTAPNFNTPPPGSASLLDLRYYGVFLAGGSTNASFNLEYNYTGYPGIVNEDDLGLLDRANNADTNWLGTGSTVNTTANTLSVSGATAGEYIMSYSDSLSTFNLLGPPSSTSVSLSGTSTQTVSFNWERSQLSNPASIQYEWLLDNAGGDFSAPILTKTANVSGTDSTYDISYQELANLLTNGLGIIEGQALNAIWTVRAFVGNSSRMANQEFSIELTRGILDTDFIFNFSLNEPDDDTLLVYNNGTDEVHFSWLPTASSAGGPVTYEVTLAGENGTFSSPFAVYQADNSGLDTVASVSHATVANDLANVGFGNGFVFRFKWIVDAVSSSLSRRSIDSNYVYLVREDLAWASVNEVGLSSIQIVENPITTMLNLTSIQGVNSNLMVQIYSVTGKLVHNDIWTAGNSTKSIETSSFENGVYLLRLSDQVNSVTKRVIINR